MNFRLFFFMIVLVMVSLISTGCNRSEPGPDEYPRNRRNPLAAASSAPTPTPSGTNTNGTSTNTTTREGPMKVGDVGELGDFSVKLNSFDLKESVYTINVTVQNKGQFEQNINPAFYFRIEGNDGQIATFRNFGTPDPRLKSSVPANGDVTGNISFDAISELKEPKLIFDPRGSTTPLSWLLEQQ